MIKRHPQVGAEILAKTHNMEKEALIPVKQHHERNDGTGYPDELKGEKIHHFGKICGIADVFDALTTTRSYKPALGSFAALQVMKNEMLGKFDHKFFNAFVQLLKE